MYQSWWDRNGPQVGRCDDSHQWQQCHLPAALGKERGQKILRCVTCQETFFELEFISCA